MIAGSACIVASFLPPATPPASGDENDGFVASDEPPPSHQTDDMPPVQYAEYVNAERGFRMKVPRDWQMDTPNGVLEREFHPKSEYGGRRCTVIVAPYGKVEDNMAGNVVKNSTLGDLGSGYESAEILGKSKANAFAPLDGPTGGVKAATFLVGAREKDDGKFFFYEWRSQALLNFHFWEVATLGPGAAGDARKLKRKDVVTVKCQMPEDGMTSSDVEIFETIVNSLELLPEKEVRGSEAF